MAFSLLALILLGPVVGAEAPEKVQSGVSLAIDGRYEEALQIFQQLLRRDPDRPLFHYLAGMCHFYLDNLRVARAHLEIAAAAERQESFPKAYFWLAQVHLTEDRHQKALSVVEDGLRRFPQNQDLLDLDREIREATAR